MHTMKIVTLASVLLPIGIATAFVSPRGTVSRSRPVLGYISTTTAREIDSLKKVLEREYVSFFDPMERDYYSPDVTFVDPLTSLRGVDSYQSNVDMLTGRTLLGKFLFRDASIVLHTVTGGDALENGNLSDIVTRWTLHMTIQILPWKPTARFTGISVYKIRAGGPKGVQVVQQTDYWDSINLKNGQYAPVDKSHAVSDFLRQLQPNDINAPSAGTEVPYQLLRRGQDYEVRRYPAMVVAQAVYTRRDEGYAALGDFTEGLNPLSPAVFSIGATKRMQWPLRFAAPGEVAVQSPATGNQDVDVITIPSRVIAVGTFSDASVEPVVRRAAENLKMTCERDGLVVANGDLQFAQYDAIFSVGKRRGEVWMELKNHPWPES